LSGRANKGSKNSQSRNYSGCLSQLLRQLLGPGNSITLLLRLGSVENSITEPVKISQCKRSYKVNNYRKTNYIEFKLRTKLTLFEGHGRVKILQTKIISTF